jgi:hypothetical protein
MVDDRKVSAIIIGDTGWSWSQSGKVRTNAGDPHSGHGMGPGYGLIDLTQILPAADFRPAGHAIFLGRRVIRVVAIPSAVGDYHEEGPHWSSATHRLGSGAEYALLVDAERGVLLRSEALLEDNPFRVIEMETVTFDEQLDDETFAPPRDSDN